MEYLLACSASKLKHLTVRLCVVDLFGKSLGKLLGCTHAGPCLRRLLEQLEQSLTQLPPLSSLVLVISLHRNVVDTGGPSAMMTIRFATMILKHVNRDHLTDVRVEFKADTLAVLGALLSKAGALLDACKQLDEALLTFPKAPVLVCDPMYNWRAGRAKFWSPIIRRAFPRLDERGLLTTPCEWKLVSR